MLIHRLPGAHVEWAACSELVGNTLCVFYINFT